MRKKIKIPIINHKKSEPKSGPKLDPERKKLLNEAYKETVRKYDSVLKKLGKT